VGRQTLNQSVNQPIC